MINFFKTIFTNPPFYQFLLAFIAAFILLNWRQQIFRVGQDAFRFGCQLKQHYRFLRSNWLWLAIGFILATVCFSLGLNLVHPDFTALATIIINSLTAIGTIAAVWANFYLYHKDYQKKVAVNAISTYLAHDKDENTTINFEAYAVNLSKFTLRLKFAGFILSDGYTEYEIGNAREHAEVISSGEQTKVYFARNHRINHALKKLQIERLANYSAEQWQQIEPDQFKLTAIFHEEDSAAQNYSFTTTIDLADATFWHEIKHAARAKSKH